MRVWMHKQTGQLGLVGEYWVPHQITSEYSVRRGWFPGYKVATGMFKQTGWTFQNKNDVVFVLPLDCAQYFEDLGEL